MKLRNLEYLIALTETGHFGRAAALCHVSQPTLSTQIKKLEAELGVVLFERGSGVVRPTDAGAAIIELAREGLDVMERIRVTARAARDPFSGRVRLGAIPTVSPYLAPELLSWCATRLPDLDVRFREDVTQELTRALLAGDIDAAILATPPEDRRLAAIAAFDDPMLAILPIGHALAKADTLCAAELNTSDLLLLPEGHCFRDQAVDLCAARPPGRPRLDVGSLKTIIRLVAANQGVSLLPAMALSDGGDDYADVVVRPLAERGAARTIQLVHRRSTARVQLMEALVMGLSKIWSETRPGIGSRVSEPPPN